MGVKVLNNLVNKNDVLGILDGIYRHLNPNDFKQTRAILEMVGDSIKHLTPINIIEAGDINIVCEDSIALEQYLSKRKE